MSRKNTLVTKLGPTGAGPSAIPFSLATSFTTPATVIRYLDNCSFQINVSTTDSQGIFEIQVSDDYYVNEGNDSVVANPGNWIPLTLAGGTPTVAGVDTLIGIALTQLPYYGIKVAYISSVAGTGTCQIYITNKGLA